MSFSQKTKNELTRIDTEKACCKKSLLGALISMNGEVLSSKSQQVNLKISLENPAVARRVFKLIKELFGIHPEIKVRKSSTFKKKSYYLIAITQIMGSIEILEACGLYEEHKMRMYPKEDFLNSRCCIRAYLRGAFLSGGSVASPEKNYHLEFVTESLERAEKIQLLMEGFGLYPRIIQRKKYYVVYLKEGDQIVDLLNILGAHQSLMSLENTRILKEMRNNINRIVNCETANLSKTVNASVRQLENIDKIRSTIGLEALPEALRQLAELRLKHEDASLKELGEMMDPVVGKSGVNHRFRRIESLANKVQSSKTENKT